MNGEVPDEPGPSVPPKPESRSPIDRRRYNRRTVPSEISPPYYEVFERIADALEGIERELHRAVLPPPQ